MKRLAIIITVALLLTVPSGPVAAQWGTGPGSIFPSAMGNLNALFSGQDPIAPAPGSIFPSAMGNLNALFSEQDPIAPAPSWVFPWALDRLDSMLAGTEPTLPPMSWGGDWTQPSSLVSPLFDFLGNQFSADPGDFDFTPPAVPGVYIGGFFQYTGMSDTSSSTIITGIPGQQPVIDFQQSGWADQMQSWSYFFDVQ